MRKAMLRLVKVRNTGRILFVPLFVDGENATTAIPKPQLYVLAIWFQIQDTNVSAINAKLCFLDLDVKFEAFAISARGYEL